MILQPLTTALVQLTSTDDFSSNQKQVFAGLAQVQNLGGARLVVLPENALYMRLNREAPLQPVALTAPIFKDLSSYCQNHRCDLLLTTPIQEQDQVANATVHLKSTGEVEIVYRKIHLFDVDVRGVPPVRESDDFRHGGEPSIIEVEGWKIGLSVCYDLRFSELYAHYVRQGVHALTVPAAFLVPTGRAHWEVLLRARAIECQAYVLAPAQGGTHENQQKDRRKTWGHSMTINPWGEIMGQVDGGESPLCLFQTLDPDHMESVRQQIPMNKHRRLN